MKKVQHKLPDGTVKVVNLTDPDNWQRWIGTWTMTCNRCDKDNAQYHVAGYASETERSQAYDIVYYGRQQAFYDAPLPHTFTIQEFFNEYPLWLCESCYHKFVGDELQQSRELLDRLRGL